MPNWTQNELTVEGETKEVHRFLKHMGEGFSFEKIIPMPEDCFKENLGEAERKECAAKGIPNWYDWCRENWGTKWDCSEVEIEVWNENEVDDDFIWVTYQFKTAWAAPHPVIAKLKSDWPHLSFCGGYVHEGHEGCGSW
tara:strand:+ start:479 stop:895 length:417 start_codon:yes stop_codon:yes gene_type:complete